MPTSRSGATSVTTLLGVVGTLLMLAYLLDSGHLMMLRRHMIRACDDAALAAATSLAETQGKPLTIQDARLDRVRDRAIETAASRRVFVGARDVEFGHRQFDPETRRWRVEWNAGPVNAVRVTARRDSPDPMAPDAKARLAFGWVIGASQVDVVESSVAAIRPRDIVWMVDDSLAMAGEALITPATIRRFGLKGVGSKLHDMHSDLGSPRFGRLPQFNPQPVRFRTALADVVAAESAVRVDFRTQVRSVRLRFADGASQPFQGGGAGQSQRYAGVKRHKNKRITRVVLDERIDVDVQDVNEIVKAWGLTDTPFPARVGSWPDYVRYVKGSSMLRYAGLNHQYGGATLLQYLLTRRHTHRAYPQFSRTRQYPLTRVKGAATAISDQLVGLQLHHPVAMFYAQNVTVLASDPAPFDRFETPPRDSNRASEPASGGNQGMDGESPAPNPALQHSAFSRSVASRQAGHDGGRGSALADAIEAASELLRTQGRPGAQPLIVIFTSSRPTSAPSDWVRPRQWQWNRYTDYDDDGVADYTTTHPPAWSSIDGAAEFARRGGRLFTACLSEDADPPFFRAVARAGGGETLDPVSARDEEKLLAFVRHALLGNQEAILLE